MIIMLLPHERPALLRRPLFLILCLHQIWLLLPCCSPLVFINPATRCSRLNIQEQSVVCCFIFANLFPTISPSSTSCIPREFGCCKEATTSTPRSCSGT